jgi:carboxyl-terminal processing protease
MFILSKTYSLINLYFVHWQDAPNLNLDELYKEIIPKVIEVDNAYDFFLVMLDFLTPLNNGHTAYIDFAFLPQNRGYLGFNFSKIDNKWVVTQSYLESIQNGDMIVTIDGMNFEDYYMQMKKYIFASGERARISSFTVYPFLFPIEFTINLDGGKKVKINQKENISLMPAYEVEGRWLEEGKIGYIKIPHFNFPKMEESALEFVEEFFSAKALILDLRENQGGSTPMNLIKKLMNKPFRWWTESTKQHFGIFNFRYEQYMYSKMLENQQDIKDKESNESMISILQPFSRAQMVWYSDYYPVIKDCFQGKIFILIDGLTISAGEDFVMPFKDNNRATIIGETTRGSTGQPYMYQFDERRMVIIGAKRTYFPDGSPFEGVGIKPDIEIKPTIEDIKKGKDPVMEYVLKNLG